MDISQQSCIVGIGIDECDTDRIRNLMDKYGDTFLKKTFTTAEIQYCSARANAAESYAARFAAKEAMAKALGTGFAGGISLLGLSVENDLAGAPHAVLDKAAKEKMLALGAAKMLVSLTHLKDRAQAIAILSK